MRVAIVTDTFPPEVNGVARTLQRLADGLVERGHEVDVIHPGAAAGPCGRRSPVRSIPLPGYPGLRLGLPCPLKLGRRWREWRPDVVYVATESPLGLSAIRAGGALGIPVASGYHTHFQLYVREYRLAPLARFATHYLREVHNRTACTFAPSADLGLELEADGFRNVRLLGRGVDAALFHPGRRDAELRCAWGAGDGTPVVAVVGRVAGEKNLGLAFEAFDRIRRRVPDARLVVVGDGPRRAELQRRHGEAVFAGMRRGEDLARHYASADLFLFPSLTETFGNVLLEALASGLVTVSFKYAASAQHVLDPHNGFQAPHGDREAFLERAVHGARRAFDAGIRARAREAGAAAGWVRIVAQFADGLAELARPASGSAPSHAFTQPDPRP